MVCRGRECVCMCVYVVGGASVLCVCGCVCAVVEERESDVRRTQVHGMGTSVCVRAQVSSIIISSKTTQDMPPHTKSSHSDLGTWLCRRYDGFAGLMLLH